MIEVIRLISVWCAAAGLVLVNLLMLAMCCHWLYRKVNDLWRRWKNP